MGEEKGPDKQERLTNKIKHVLTECRVVLPGAQALLGFQFICVLTESFDRLRRSRSTSTLPRSASTR